MTTTLGDIALIITALATLINAISSYRNGRKLNLQDKKMDEQTHVLADVQRATNGELAPKIADAVVEKVKEKAPGLI